MFACPRCGAQIGQGALFCANCGCAFASPAGTGPRLVQARTGQRTAFMVAAIVLTGCLAFALGASGLLRGKSDDPSSGLAKGLGKGDTGLARAQGAGDTGLTKNLGSGDTGVTQMTAPVDAPMPDNIRDWLEHLRKTEERRVTLATEQVGQAMRMATMLSIGGAEEFLKGMLEDPDKDPAQPHEQVKIDVDEMRASWTELHTFFNSKVPPDECLPIYNEYDPALNETGAFISDILGPLSGSIEGKADQDDAIAKLLKMQNKSKSAIDDPAIRADELVAKICDKYHTQKWFKLRGDIGGGGGMLQLPAGIKP